MEALARSGQPRVNEILPGLYLGDMRASQDFSVLMDVSFVVNCSKDLPFQDTLVGIERMRVPVHDNLEPSEIDALYSLFDVATEAIHRHIRRGHGVLVHCYAGRQRSAALVTAFLMRYGGMGLAEAAFFVRAQRRVAFVPRMNFYRALRRYEKKLKL